MDLSKSAMRSVVSKNHDIYICKASEELYRKIEFFTKKGGSFLVITGEDRSGKTTFAKYVVEHLNMDEHETILVSVLSDEVRSGWLIPKICTRLGIELTEKTKDLSSFISDKLDELFEENKNLTIVVDGAEKIRTSSAFEEIEFLLEVQTLSDSRINFILLGEDLLLEKIKTTPLINKISYFCTLPLLDRDEIYDYFCYRIDELSVPNSLISEEGIDYVCKISAGKISNVSLILDNCIIEAKLKNIDKIDKRMIQEVVQSHILMFKEQGLSLEEKDSNEVFKTSNISNMKQNSNLASMSKSKSKSKFNSNSNPFIPPAPKNPPVSSSFLDLNNDDNSLEDKTMSTQLFLHQKSKQKDLDEKTANDPGSKTNEWQESQNRLDRVFDNMSSSSDINGFSTNNPQLNYDTPSTDSEDMEFLKLLKKSKVKA